MIRVPVEAAASPQSALDYATRYETLRAWAVERGAPAARDGLALLLRKGVAAWVEAWSELPAPGPRKALSEHLQPAPLPDGASAELVRLLAAMALEHIQEARG